MEQISGHVERFKRLEATGISVTQTARNLSMRFTRIYFLFLRQETENGVAAWADKTITWRYLMEHCLVFNKVSLCSLHSPRTTRSISDVVIRASALQHWGSLI